jgi:hypothetical protein
MRSPQQENRQLQVRGIRKELESLPSTLLLYVNHNHHVPASSSRHLPLLTLVNFSLSSLLHSTFASQHPFRTIESIQRYHLTATKWHIRVELARNSSLRAGALETGTAMTQDITHRTGSAKFVSWVSTVTKAVKTMKSTSVFVARIVRRCSPAGMLFNRYVPRRLNLHR